MAQKKEITFRKKAHLDICQSNYVETGDTQLSHIHFVHKALPNINFDEVNTSIHFLKKHISYPFFISCMTGGTRGAYNYNARFAEAAQKLNIPVGLGSIRILLENEKLLKEFQLKKIAPSVPLIANIGAAQLTKVSLQSLDDVLKDLEADAIALHLNPAQELYQEHGQRNFTNIFEYIQEYIAQSSIPVIIKETGFGLHPHEVQQLLGAGAHYVDIAGSGGTNWALVELYRTHSIEKQSHLFTSMAHWGNPTGLLLLALYKTPSLIASGGIRNAHDIAICLALGAKITGLALPILHNAKDTTHLISFLQDLGDQLKKIMMLCEAHCVEDMQKASFWLEPHLQTRLINFCKACNIEVPLIFK